MLTFRLTQGLLGSYHIQAMRAYGSDLAAQLMHLQQQASGPMAHPMGVQRIASPAALNASGPQQAMHLAGEALQQEMSPMHSNYSRYPRLNWLRCGAG